MTFSEPILPFFVYGTLRHGQRNYHLLLNKTLKELPATLSGVVLYAMPAFPALTEGNSTVIGELIMVEPSHYARTLGDLDRLEGYTPGAPEAKCMYTRVMRQVTLADGNCADAWVYLGTPTLFESLPHQMIAHGDWCRYVKDRG